MSQRLKAEALLVVTTMIWGSTFVVVKGALRDASPLPFISIRFILAGALLFLVLRGGWMSARTLARGFVLGVFLFAGYLLQTSGLLYTTPSKSAFITGFAVILVPFMQTLYGFRLRKATVVGALSGLLGIYFLVLPSGLHAVNHGDLLTLVGAACFGLHIVLVGSYTRRFSFRHLVPVQILTVGLLAAFAWPLGLRGRLNWTVALVGAILLTAVLATGFAFAVQNWAQQFTPPAHTALIFALEPVFAALTSRIVMAEHFGGKIVLGSALILGGMVVSELWGGSSPSPIEG
ncbi:MAG: DMT family transporter [Acidobacteriia bacterium]|nr:DMT family transporter [Terriglobia bacterium]